jgi:glycosyltransferase involved in cell wall biosynthesis
MGPRKCWPVITGGRVRDYNLMRVLAQRAAVTHFAVCHPSQEPKAADDGYQPPEVLFERQVVLSEARSYGLGNILRGLAGPTPVNILNFTIPVAADALAALGREMAFDAIQLEGAHLVRYLPTLRAFPGRPPILCDWHDILSEGMWRYSDTASLPRRIYARRTAVLLEGVERELLRSCDTHAAVSERERIKLSAIAPSAKIHVIENGVDTAYYDAARIENPNRNRILFVGSMEYHANIEGVTRFAREVWPRVRARFPELRFTIAGRDPAPEVIALASQPGIEVTGTIPDVRPYYREALLAVVPLRLGTGTRLKILEAMAAGVPVVSSTLGAEGLEGQPGHEILIADSASDTFDSIVGLRSNAELWRTLADHGRELAVLRYDWEVLGKRLYSIHENAVEHAAGRA